MILSNQSRFKVRELPPRVLESNIQPVLPEESEEMHTAHAADGASLRQEVCGEEVTDAAADALAARVVPVGVSIEPDIAARKRLTEFGSAKIPESW